MMEDIREEYPYGLRTWRGRWRWTEGGGQIGRSIFLQIRLCKGTHFYLREESYFRQRRAIGRNIQLESIRLGIIIQKFK